MYRLEIELEEWEALALREAARDLEVPPARAARALLRELLASREKHPWNRGSGFPGGRKDRIEERLHRVFHDTAA